jgi:uracil-DNA glycosylase
LLDGEIGGFPTTSRVLRQLLAPARPAEVFLTNAFIGLPDVVSDTAPFPTTPSFVGRCKALLGMEIDLFRPRVVVCLGVPAARLLAAMTPVLAPWRPWPGYGELDRRAGRVVRGCSVAGVDFASVATHHPSAVLSAVERRRDTQMVALAVQRP